MNEDEPSPLDYADPDQQPAPMFSMQWGGWVLLALAAIAAGITLAEWFK